MSKNVAKIGEYILGKKLGQGSVGKVKEGIHEVTGQKVAVKIINKQLVDQSRDRGLDKRIHREINIMKALDHANVIKLYTVSEDTQNWYIVMELVTGGELFDYIVAHGYLKENVAKRIFIQILSGVAYCHSMSVIHRDLKPENILLTTNRDVKITDFGLSNFFAKNELLKTYCGSPTYTAPELLEGRPYEGTSADIWSMGVILYAMLCGCPPYANSNVTLLSREIRNTVPEIPEFLSKEAGSLILDMLVVDPTKRMTVEQIISHPWLLSVKGYILHHNAPKKPDSPQTLSQTAQSGNTSPNQKKTPRTRSNSYTVEGVTKSSPRGAVVSAPPIKFEIPKLNEKPTVSTAPPTSSVTPLTPAPIVETKSAEVTPKSPDSTPKSTASEGAKRRSINDKTPLVDTMRTSGSPISENPNRKSANGVHATPGTVIDKLRFSLGISSAKVAVLKELRQLRTQFDTKTITSKPIDQILHILDTFLTSKGVEYKHRDNLAIYICTSKHNSKNNTPEKVKFQIEVIKVYRLDACALYFHRLRGNIWAFKNIIDKLTEEIAPILTPPGSVNTAAAAYARDDNDVIDWWDFLNSAPEEPKAIPRKHSLPENSAVPNNNNNNNNNEESALVDWREILHDSAH